MQQVAPVLKKCSLITVCFPNVFCEVLVMPADADGCIEVA